MDASEKQKAAMLVVFNRLSEKDREWILLISRRVAKQVAWNGYLAGEMTTDEVGRIWAELSHA